jgi:two-component system, OmpR family, response regulator MprA
MENNLPTILLIDDDEALLEAVGDKLVAKGYAVSSAKNGVEGVALALAGHPDLILLDIVMPQMNGWEVLDALSKDAWGKTAHVVMLSNSDDMENISQAVEHNMKEYIIKGAWPLDELVRKIEEKLQK